jgi:hypothetical protein
MLRYQRLACFAAHGEAYTWWVGEMSPQELGCFVAHLEASTWVGEMSPQELTCLVAHLEASTWVGPEKHHLKNVHCRRRVTTSKERLQARSGWPV